jgi:hypothetical protein
VCVLKVALACLRSERGQSLILAALAMVAMLGFAALAIDVGYWFSQEGEVQKAVDAAALAGAQELPDNYVMAESKAREYLGKNGVSTSKGDTITITFRCTSTYQVACNPSTNHWDTIVVKVERPAQAWFARVFGIQEALIKNIHAAGCRGSCGGAAYQPVDVVQIIDRTGSMTLYGSQKLAHAKAGAEALLEYFDPSLQRVGLGVLPASQSYADPTHVVTSGPGVWVPVQLTDQYQLSGGGLDHSSRLVNTIDNLESSGGTDLGSPVKAATDELVANGRPDMTWGIILLTDGVANLVPGFDTGYRSPTANLAASGGDGNGFESITNPATNAYADGGGYAEDVNSGSGSQTSCGDSHKDRHDFFNYGISVPSGNRIDGIEVRLDAWINSTSFFLTRYMCVQLSWDGGLHWTTTGTDYQTSSLSTSQHTYTLGGSGDNWGHSWTPSELSDANFRVRVTDVASDTSRTFRLDWVAVEVYYSPNTSGPCQYAADQADAAKALNPPIEIFTIGYGLDQPVGGPGCGRLTICDCDTGAWRNRPVQELLEYMATDAGHFFDEPSTADLRPLFEVIGSQLAGGSRLVE